MNWLIFLKYVLVMALVTYLVRVVPYICMKKEVKSKFFKSFLAYVPYTVLAAMTIPSILFATDNIWSAAIGLIVGIIVAFFERGLLVVAVSSCAAVLVVELLQRFVF
ncbi:MAG: AzlD domain-containing protein [Lachnospiraceae bacterium]|nr:AzlD domain-containing protein [Lachnospiraceae bacterium]